MVQAYVAGTLAQTKYQTPTNQLSPCFRREPPALTELEAMDELLRGRVVRQRGIFTVAQARMGRRVIVDAIPGYLGRGIRPVTVVRGPLSVSNPHTPVGSSSACRGGLL